MKTLSRPATLALLIAAITFSTKPTRAASGEWNTNTSGNWSTAGNWTPAAVPGGIGSTVSLMFNISLADKTVTIDTTTQTVGILNIGDPGITYRSYTLAASGGASLILDNGGSSAKINKVAATSAVTDTISAPLLLNSNLVISDNAPASLNISGGITANTAGTKTISNQGTGAYSVQISDVIGDGSGKIAVTQNSTTSSLTLSGANTHTGHTLITAGTLTLGNNLALQNSILDTSGAGTLAFSSGINTPTFGGLTSSSSKNLTLASNVTALILNPGTGVTATYSGVLGSVTAGMTLSKTGEGTQSLSGANTYTGGTTVSVGTLLVNNTTGSGTGSGSLSVSSGAFLGGTGTISGATTVSGSLSAGDGGNSIAKLVFGNSLDLTTSQNITFDIGGTNRGINYDAIDVTGALTNGGDLVLNFASAFLPTTETIFNLFALSGGQSADFRAVSITGLYNALLVKDSFGVWTGTDDFNSRTFTFSQSTGNLAVVPEPSTWVLLTISLSTVMIFRRRR